MRSRKLTALLMTTALCATALFGCGDSDENTTTAAQGGQNGSSAAEDEEKTLTLTVWAPENEQKEENGKWLQTMCEKFNTEHPKWNITFKYEVCSEGDAGTKVSQDPTAAADVYMFANDQLTTLKNCGGIARLGGDTETYVKNTNSDTIVDSVSVDGAVYGIPYTTNIWFMYYNTDVFSADDVKNLDTMLEKGKVAFPLENSWYIQAFFLATGCTIGPDSDPGFDFANDGGYEAGEYMIGLVNNPNFMVGEGVALLQDGQAGAVFSGSWDLKSAKEFLGDKLGVAAIPTINATNGDGQLRAFAGSKAIAVNPNCKDQKVAVELAKFLASEDAQKAHYELNGVVPCNTALLEDEAISKDPVFIAQNESFDKASILQQTYLGDATWWDASKALTQSIISKDTTSANIKEAVQALETLLTEKLEAAQSAN